MIWRKSYLLRDKSCSELSRPSRPSGRDAVCKGRQLESLLWDKCQIGEDDAVEVAKELI
jgi:hypothetical protein